MHLGAITLPLHKIIKHKQTVLRKTLEISERKVGAVVRARNILPAFGSTYSLTLSPREINASNQLSQL